VGGYDGMHIIYKGLEATKGEGGQALLDAMKGLSFESPRGPVTIDPATREIVQDMYVRKVEKVGGVLFNVEFDAIKQLKDPAKAGK
jgi:branched-chain amino acid transport system substrate-binding protein